VTIDALPPSVGFEVDSMTASKVYNLIREIYNEDLEIQPLEPFDDGTGEPRMAVICTPLAVLVSKSIFLWVQIASPATPTCRLWVRFILDTAATISRVTTGICKLLGSPPNEHAPVSLQTVHGVVTRPSLLANLYVFGNQALEQKLSVASRVGSLLGLLQAEALEIEPVLSEKRVQPGRKLYRE